MDCDLVGLRHLFGIVAQETVLFNDTVYNNIAYGMMDAGESKVIEAARAAKAFLQGALEHAEPLGAGHGPVNHLWRQHDA